MIIITGATGHIGNNFARLLKQNNVPFKMLLRKPHRSIENIECIKSYGDIFDIHFLTQEVQSNDIFVHFAGFIDLKNQYFDEAYYINDLGTRIIIDYCKDHDVKFVYTSSVDVIEKSKNSTRIGEPTTFHPEQHFSFYAKTKASATKYLYELSQNQEIDTLIFYPSAVIGINDFKPSAAGKAIAFASRKKCLIGIHGGYNFIDVEDCVEAIYQAILLQKQGSYILSGHNASIKEIYHLISKIKQRKKVVFTLSNWFLKVCVKLVPGFTKVMIEALLDNYQYDNTKMRSELLSQLTPLETTLKKTILWFEHDSLVQNE